MEPIGLSCSNTTYSTKDMDNISHTIRSAANKLFDQYEKSSDLRILYAIHYAIPEDGTRPFELQIEDDMPVTKNDVKRAIEIASQFPEWNEIGVTEYLKQLLAHMQTS